MARWHALTRPRTAMSDAKESSDSIFCSATADGEACVYFDGASGSGSDVDLNALVCKNCKVSMAEKRAQIQAALGVYPSGDAGEDGAITITVGGSAAAEEAEAEEDRRVLEEYLAGKGERKDVGLGLGGEMMLMGEGGEEEDPRELLDDAALAALEGWCDGKEGVDCTYEDAVVSSSGSSSSSPSSSASTSSDGAAVSSEIEAEAMKAIAEAKGGGEGAQEEQENLSAKCTRCGRTRGERKEQMGKAMDEYLATALLSGLEGALDSPGGSDLLSFMLAGDEEMAQAIARITEEKAKAKGKDDDGSASAGAGTGSAAAAGFGDGGDLFSELARQMGA